MWEYKVVDVRPAISELLEQETNKYGREGWELVCMSDYGGSGYTLVFKRPK